MRTLVLHPDWNASLCWHDAEGCSVADERGLAISHSLRQQLEEFYSGWSELCLANDSGLVSPTDWRLLDERGFQIWQHLRAEIGSRYHVHFYSHEFTETFESPEEFKRVTGRSIAEPEASSFGAPASSVENSNARDEDGRTRHGQAPDRQE